MSTVAYASFHGIDFPRLRLVSPYDIVSSVVMQTASGATHLPAVAGVKGKPQRNPMFECGLNSSANGLTPVPKRIDGPTIVSCRRCTMIALLRLSREGLLKWSACARRPVRGRR